MQGDNRDGKRVSVFEDVTKLGAPASCQEAGQEPEGWDKEEEGISEIQEEEAGMIACLYFLRVSGLME